MKWPWRRSLSLARVVALLTFEECFGLLVDYQMTDLKTDGCRTGSSMQNFACTPLSRILILYMGGIDRSAVMTLAGNQWVMSHHNITG